MPPLQILKLAEDFAKPKRDKTQGFQNDGNDILEKKNFMNA